MEDTVTLESEKTEQQLSAIIGPGWQERWLYWTSRTKEQVVDIYICTSVNFHLRSNLNSSVVRQKGECQNGCSKKAQHAKISEKQTFLHPDTHTYSLCYVLIIS